MMNGHAHNVLRAALALLLLAPAGSYGDSLLNALNKDGL
jgi:hypothetical protein